VTDSHFPARTRPLISRSYKDPEAFEKAALAEDTPAPVEKKPKAKKGPLAVDAEEDDDSFETVGNKGKVIAISSEGIYKALAQVLEARGRKVSFYRGPNS
jgi:translation initiation factor 3 subunit C